MDVIIVYAHYRFDYLDLDGRLQWVGKGKKSALNAPCNYIKLATTVGHFLRDLDLAKFI